MVLLESTVIKFCLVNREIKVFPGKVNLKERSFSYSKMNTLLFLCFYFSCWLWNVFFVENRKVPLSERRWTVCSSFKINTMIWVFCFFLGCVLLILTMICFAFFWWKEWQVQDSVTVLGHFQHCSVMRLSCRDELMNNDILLSLSFAWYV